MERSEGNLIVFEGIDGAGKSVLLAKVQQQLGAKWPSYPYYVTSEPASARPKAPGLLPLTRLFRFLEERADHVPAIRKHQIVGNNVLCDRFTPSTLVYQHDVIEQFGLYGAVYAAQAPLVPDLVVLVATDPQVAVERIGNRIIHGGAAGEGDFMHLPSVEHLGKLQARYLEVLMRPGVCHDYLVVRNAGPLSELDDAAEWITELLADRFWHRRPMEVA